MRLSCRLLSLITLPLLVVSGSAATFNLAGDWLADANGVQGVPNGSLIMLIASTKDDQFSEPSASGFVAPGSDDVILGAFTANDAGGYFNQGSYTGTVRANYGDANKGLQDFDPGDVLIMRWFPTLTESALKSLPTGAIPYGEFRRDQILPGSDSAWVSPSGNGDTVSLSLGAKTLGNRYNPQGMIDASQLMATRVIGDTLLGTAQAQLNISFLAGGSLAITWPLLEGANPIGRLQQSKDLIDWTEVSAEIETLSASGMATTRIPSHGGTLFYRIASE